MASFPIPAIRKRGPILNGLTALPASLKMMTVDDAGNMGTQDIPVAPVLSWGNITGTLSAQTDLQSSLDAKANSSALASYLPLTGGTLTGGLSGTTAAFSGNISAANGTFNGRLIASGGFGFMGIGTTGHILEFPTITGFLNLSMGTRGTGFSDRCQLQFQPAHNMAGFAATQEGFYVAAGSLIGFSASNPKTDAPDTVAYRDSANTWGFRNGTNAQRINLYNTFTNTSNYIRQSLSFTTYSAVVHAQLAAEGLGTGAVNIPFVLTPRGTGAFILGPMPDGTATGGNARGSNAIDLQLSRTAATQVGSGDNSVAIGNRNTAATNGTAIGFTNNAGATGVAIGRDCTAGGGGSIAIGSELTAASNSSAIAIGTGAYANTYACGAIGRSPLSSHPSKWTQAWGLFATNGDMQFYRTILANKTTNNTPTVLACRTVFSTTDRPVITNGNVLSFVAQIVGIKSDGSAVAMYVRKGCIKRVGTSTSIVGSIETIGTDIEDNALTDVSITADDTNEALQISVTGISGETWRWVAVVEGVEIGYGT